MSTPRSPSTPNTSASPSNPAPPPPAPPSPVALCGCYSAERPARARGPCPTAASPSPAVGTAFTHGELVIGELGHTSIRTTLDRYGHLMLEIHQAEELRTVPVTIARFGAAD